MPEDCPGCKLGQGVHPEGGEHDFGVAVEEPKPTTPLPEPINYEGWAPCFHGGGKDNTKTDEEWTVEREAWLKKVSPPHFWGDPSTTKVILGGADAQVGICEKFLWELSLMRTVTCMADQWVGVGVEGGEPCVENPNDDPELDCHHEEWPSCRKIKTYIQGDDFTVALAESYRWWNARDEARKAQAPS